MASSTVYQRSDSFARALSASSRYVAHRSYWYNSALPSCNPVFTWRECSGCDTCLVRERLAASRIDCCSLLGLVSVVLPSWLAGVAESQC
jgi:hypothetical protein